jgi:hypothetical protein
VVIYTLVHLRYNSSLVTWEGYNGTQWTGLGGGNPWATTSTSITVAANDRYFVDTFAGAVTITLPASPQAGDQVRLIDLRGTFDTNNLTIARNGNLIMGDSARLNSFNRKCRFRTCLFWRNIWLEIN